MRIINFDEMIGKSATKKKVLLRGPVLTQSGYGVHTRQIASWLLSREDLELEVQAMPWGETPWLISPDLHDGLIGKIMERTVDPQGKVYDVTVQVQLPNEWDTNLGKVNIGITAGVETDKANPEWVSCCNKMSAVIVPSNHAKTCFTNAGNVKVPIHVIPEAFSSSLLDASTKTSIDDYVFSTSFNFLVFGQITGNNPENDRKNIFYTVKWFCENFKSDEDVGLVIKTNSGKNTKIDRRIVTQLFRNLVKEVRQGPFPKIHLLHGDMTDQEIASLYRHPQIKALLSLTRGEGYGLPILEAAASGLPVIATGWSGHVDFLSHGKFIDVGFKLDNIHSSRVDNKIFFKDMKWAHPQEDDFKKKITKFRVSPSIPQEWAKDLKTKLVEKYSLSAIIAEYNKVTKELV